MIKNGSPKSRASVPLTLKKNSAVHLLSTTKYRTVCLGSLGSDFQKEKLSILRLKPSVVPVVTALCDRCMGSAS